MAYHDPGEVKSPRGSWKWIEVLDDKGKGQYAVAIGVWSSGGPADGKCVFAMRWNGDDDHVGHPQARGIPTWFAVPPVYRECLLTALPADKQAVARERLGLRP